MLSRKLNVLSYAFSSYKIILSLHIVHERTILLRNLKFCWTDLKIILLES